MKAQKGQPRRSTRDKAIEAARHAEVRARALDAIAWRGAQGPGAVDIESLAEQLGAEIVFEDLEGAKARVIQIGSRARIIVSTRIVDAGSIRFSIAHEIGHLLLKHFLQRGDLDRVLRRQRTCTPLNGDGSDDERDASVFATELLMPTPLVTPMCQVAPTSLEPVRAIASAFRTSVLASARRFVELTPERCAVVYTKQGRVQWVQKSPSFRAWVPEDRSVAPPSGAFDYFNGGVIDESSRIVPAATWVARGATASDEMYEHATAVPELGAVFSLLWMPDVA